MWAAFAISLVFVVCGLALLRSDFDVAIVTLAFFGSCALVTGSIARRRWRGRQPPPEHVELMGGVPLRASRLVLGGTGAWIAILGTIMFIFGSSYEPGFRVLSVVMAVVGAILFAGVATGWVGADYLQFDPAGMTFGRRGFAYTIPWDNVARLEATEFYDNAVILIWLHDPERVDATPPASRPKAIRELNRPIKINGAHVMLQPLRYGLDASLLAQALTRYVADPAARHELSARAISR